MSPFPLRKYPKLWQQYSQLSLRSYPLFFFFFSLWYYFSFSNTKTLPKASRVINLVLQFLSPKKPEGQFTFVLFTNPAPFTLHKAKRPVRANSIPMLCIYIYIYISFSSHTPPCRRCRRHYEKLHWCWKLNPSWVGEAKLYFWISCMYYHLIYVPKFNLPKKLAKIIFLNINHCLFRSPFSLSKPIWRRH